MRATFIGTGEAFDERLPNTSVLIESKINLLLDCGYSVPRSLWSRNSGKDFLEAIYITHFHADHYFGLVPIITRMWESGRTKKLTLIGQKDLKERIGNMMALGYPGFLDRLKFKIAFKKASVRFRIGDLSIKTAQTQHSVKNLAVRVSDGKKSLSYSGDGVPTEESCALYESSDALVHDSFLLDKTIPGVHPCIRDVLTFSPFVKKLYLVHMQRDLRRNKRLLSKVTNGFANVHVPDAMDKIML
ncbi:MAG: ribonuclease Z [Candidatus Aenigmarchaeota archaeon]|nr:ribonuclease Z [Candidatus Aenigmarchaeota archaeon]